MHQIFQTSINDCLLSSELCGHHVLFFRQLQDTYVSFTFHGIHSMLLYLNVLVFFFCIASEDTVLYNAWH